MKRRTARAITASHTSNQNAGGGMKKAELWANSEWRADRSNQGAAMTQLFSDSENIDRAIRELEQALPIEALRSIIANREAKHRPRAELRRRLELLRAEQILREIA
jgi:hypothetical protein